MKIIIKNSNKTLEIKDEKNLLEFLKNNKISIKDNCEGNCSCGQCLVEFEKDLYEKMELSEEELDVIDLQIKKTKYSRLACQVKIDDLIDGCVVKIL